MRRLLRLAAFVSMLSVSVNTPVTFYKHEFLLYVTFFFDLAILALFTAEMIAKMHIRGVMKVSHLKTFFSIMLYTFTIVIISDISFFFSL